MHGRDEVMAVALKSCTKCGVEKDASCFGRDNRHKDGLQSHCSDCQKTAQRQRYAENIEHRERIKARTREWVRSNPERKKQGDATWRQNNADRKRENWRRWKQMNPEKEQASRRRYIIRKYNLTPDRYEALLEAQNHRCAICCTDDPGGRGTWHIDHDHHCCPPSKRSCGNCVRGILCAKCNMMLGKAGDDPEILINAARYLTEWKAR